ncbi:hypothetical protein KCU67_g12469, partial [Aureobasidium melanogenum]
MHVIHANTMTEESPMLWYTAQVPIQMQVSMTSVKEKQVGDGSKEDSSHETVSGTVDVANNVKVDTTDKESS